MVSTCKHVAKTQDLNINKDELLNSDDEEQQSTTQNENNGNGNSNNSEQATASLTNVVPNTVDIQKMVNEQLAVLMNNFFAGMKEKNPPFILRDFSELEKLHGHKNFKHWNEMVKLDLQAFNLLPYIKSDKVENGSPIKSAQARQYLKKSVSASIALQLIKLGPYEAYTYLTRTFGYSRMHDLVALYHKFSKLYFKIGYDAVRYVSEFQACIEEYATRGTVFPDEYLASVFLQKIQGIHDYRTQYYTFYNTMTTKKDLTYKYVKETFLQLDHKRSGMFMYMKQYEDTTVSNESNLNKLNYSKCVADLIADSNMRDSYSGGNVKTICDNAVSAANGNTDSTNKIRDTCILDHTNKPLKRKVEDQQSIDGEA